MRRRRAGPAAFGGVRRRWAPRRRGRRSAAPARRRRRRAAAVSPICGLRTSDPLGGLVGDGSRLRSARLGQLGPSRPRGVAAASSPSADGAAPPATGQRLAAALVRPVTRRRGACGVGRGRVARRVAPSAVARPRCRSRPCIVPFSCGPPPRRARARRPAAPTASRRAPSCSIHWCVRSTRTPTGSASGKATASQLGRPQAPPDRSPSSAIIVAAVGGTSASDTMSGRTSSTRRSPLRSRVERQRVGRAAIHSARGGVVGDPPATRRSPRCTDVTTSWSDAAPGRQRRRPRAPSNPSGSASVRRSGSAEVRVRSTAPSATLDVEVLGDRLVRRSAAPARSCSVGRGVNPVAGRRPGAAARRSARSQIRADVAVAGEADLAELGEAQPERSSARRSGRSVTGHAATDRRAQVLTGALAAAGRRRRGDATTCSMPYPVHTPQS